jgi:hypothetical protein
MSSRCVTRLFLATVAGVLVLAEPAFADPPARAARVSFLTGSVAFRPAALAEWRDARINYPLTVGDHIWTDRDSRTELQLGSTVVRIAANTEFSLLNVDDRTAQLRLTQGTIAVRVRTLGVDDVVEIDTPNAAVSVLRSGVYRVEVNEAGDSTIVTVRQGEGLIETSGSSFALRDQDSTVISGLDPPRFRARPAVPIDDFESWSLARDRRWDAALSARYVSSDLIGYEDLDANGRWQVIAGYGPVWVPRVNADWVPYRFGRWAWVDPWGWTWIDDASWGFAPFHYGRWALVAGVGWVWAPGTRIERPVYAPALVAFVGGANWTASMRVDSAPVAWFPLGPQEVFVPSYRVSATYLQRLNAPHVTVNVTNITVRNTTYVNRTVPGAMTAVTRETFVHAGPVSAATVALSPEQRQRAPVLGGGAPIAPDRPSTAGASQVRAVLPPQTAVTRQVVVHHQPPLALAPYEAQLGGQTPTVGPSDERARPRTPEVSAAHPLVRAVIASPRPSRMSTPDRPSGPSGPAALAARQARELADLDTRHEKERAALETKYKAEDSHTSSAAERLQLKRSHQQEMATLETRQQQERAATQKRHEAERQKARTSP